MPKWMLLGSVLVLLCVGLGLSVVTGPQAPVAYSAPPAQTTPTATPPPTEVAPRPTEPGDYGITLLSSGLVRRYLLHLPTGYDGETPLPLLVSYHGFTGNPQSNALGTGLSNLADTEGFIVAYPEGYGDPKGWFSHQDAEEEWPDDIQFTKDLIKDLLTGYAVDPARIYITGFSNGGGMAHRVACDLSEVVAAVTAVGGTHIDEDPCLPTRPVPMMGLHGADDDVTPYLGTPGLLEGIPEWAEEWRTRNGCTPEPQISSPTPNVTVQHWTDCNAEADVILRTYTRLGHNWPSDAGQVIWSFMRQYQLDEEQVAIAREVVGATAPVQTGDFRVTLVSGGAVRAYLLHVPLSYDPATPPPVVFSFHEYGSSPVSNMQLTALNGLSESEGFIVVFPQGRGDPLAWFTEATAPEGFPTDAQFFDDILTRLEETHTIDRQRIYVTGFSLGGGMAHRLACDRAEQVAAAVIINGAHWLEQPCTPSQPVPVMAVHTLDNDVVPYDGVPDVLQSIPDWAATWAMANGCQPTPTETTPQPDTTLQTWSGCEAPLLVYTYASSGHAWPEDASALAWNFLASHTRPTTAGP